MLSAFGPGYTPHTVHVNVVSRRRTHAGEVQPTHLSFV